MASSLPCCGSIPAHEHNGDPAEPIIVVPHVRFALALAASLMLHALLLVAGGQAVPPAVSPLVVELPPRLPDEPATVPPPLGAESFPVAVPPAPTLPPVERPRALRGRALERALTALARAEFYPREAIALGLEGRVVLQLTLDAAGRVIAVKVADSSGHTILDEAARGAAMQLGTLGGGRRDVLLPVEFRLE